MRHLVCVGIGCLLCGCGVTGRTTTAGHTTPAGHSVTAPGGSRADCPSRASQPIALKLVLRDVSPTPVMSARLGEVVEVVSDVPGHQMSFVTVHPRDAVCEISRRRNRDGATEAIYRMLARSRIVFYSTYSQATNAMMPAMLGRLVVR